MKGKVIINGEEVPNTATDIYRMQIATWLSGGSAGPPRHIAVGQGTVEPSVGDIALGNETFRKAVTSRFLRGSDSARLTAIFNVDDPPLCPGSASVAIREVGLFDAGDQVISNNGFETWTIGSPDSWACDSGGSLSKESGTANIYEQAYSLLFSRTLGTPFFYQDLTFDSVLRSQKCTFRGAIKAGAASLARIFINDGIDSSYSDYHSGGNGFEVLSVNKTLGTAASRLRVGGQLVGAGSAWFDWVRCIQNGNLWARTLFSLDKQSSEPLSLIWELYFERQEEGGTMPYSAYDSEVISQGTISAGSLSPTKYSPVGQGVAQETFLTIEGSDLRYYMHGGTPSSGTGHLIDSPGSITIKGSDDIANLRFIGVSGISTVIATYYR